MSLKLSFSFSCIIFFLQKSMCEMCVCILATSRKYIIWEWKNTKLCDLLANVFIQLSFLYAT